jgi:hypothetical protein
MVKSKKWISNLRKKSIQTQELQAFNEKTYPKMKFEPSQIQSACDFIYTLIMCPFR